jgi:hypothetical protein
MSELRKVLVTGRARLTEGSADPMPPPPPWTHPQRS